MADTDSSTSPSSGNESARRPGILRVLGRWALGETESDEAARPVSEAERDLVDQAQAFQSIRVQDVMTPRADVAALDLDTPLDVVWRRFAETEHSRMPVFRETLDEPLGVVHIKDLVKLLTPGPEHAAPDWSAAVLDGLRREALYVPASMRAADLLVRMQSTRIHMALVIDEFGGTDGLVTIEDLLEAVVGEIEDEHDVETTPEIIERPGGWEADARAPLEDLEAMAGESLALDDHEEEVDTVGGLVATLAGRVPQRGEIVAHPAGYEFDVVDADPRRVKRLRVRRLERPVVSDTAA
ncbi:MAG: hemolysin family protein [Proteobacteria bacterium]|nr:hemolysin family protein [Pseudomonadota bacterium]